MCRQAVLHAGCWHVELHDALLSKGTAEEQPWENMGGCHQMAGLCWVWASSGIQRSHTVGFPGLCHDSYTWEELFWAEAGPLTLMNAWSFPSCWLPLWTNFFFFHNIFFFLHPSTTVASCFSFVAFLLAVSTLACLFLARWMQLSAEWIPSLPYVQGTHSIVGAPQASVSLPCRSSQK